MANAIFPDPAPPVPYTGSGYIQNWNNIRPHNPAGVPQVGPPQPPPPPLPPGGYPAPAGRPPAPPGYVYNQQGGLVAAGQGQNITTIAQGGQPWMAGATYPQGVVVDRQTGTVYPAGTVRNAQGQYVTPTNPNYGYYQTYPGVGGDPFFAQQQGLLLAQHMADQAAVAQQAQRALVEYGAIPTGEFSPLLGITDATRQLAEQNTGAGMSTLARIQHAANLARQQQVDQLAARGILSSGETGFQLGELALQRQQAEYDSLQQVLDRMFGLQYEFSQGDFQRRMAMFDAAINAYGRQASRMTQNDPRAGTFNPPPGVRFTG